MREPIRGLDDHRTAAGVRPRELRAIRAERVADALPGNLAHVDSIHFKQNRDNVPMAARASRLQLGGIMIKRIGFFAYGVVCYAVFFATFLYAIGFIGNVFVPKTLDGRPTASLPVSLAIDLALLALFAVQHSEVD